MVLVLASQSLSSFLSLEMVASFRPTQSLFGATCLALHLTLLWCILLAPPRVSESEDPEDDLVLRPCGSSGSESGGLVVLATLVLDL